jgi:hypothetical protein
MHDDLEGTTLQRWSLVLRRGRSRAELALTLVFLFVSLAGLSSFLEFVERRAGVVINDPLLALIPPIDFTWLTFALIYGGLVLGAGILARFPHRLLLGLQSYILMVALRIAVMYAVPLDPPAGLIPLVDPFVQFVGSGKVLTKDLFFSGHTATLFLLGLVAPGRISRPLFFGAAFVVGVCVIAQHVHYTIDVLAAPCFAYIAYRSVALARRGYRK